MNTMHKLNIRFPLLLALLLCALPGLHGARAGTISLANSPLYLGGQVDPNVFFELDDSGSMDWEVLTRKHWHFCAYTSDGCGWLVDNGLWRTNTGTQYRYFEYIFNEPDNAYSDGCDNGSRGALYACGTPVNTTNTAFSNDWRILSSSVNVLYYDPSVTYEPWKGPCLTDGTVCTNASFTSARSNPRQGTSGYSDTRNLTGVVYEVANDNKGFTGASPRAGTNINYNTTSNGLIDLWDSHTRYIVNGSSITVESYSYSPDSSGLHPTHTTTTLSNASTCYTELGGGDVSCRTIAQAQQNIANWYQYYRRRQFVAKGAVAAVVDAQPNYRYGISMINNYGNLFVNMPAAGTTNYSSHNDSLLANLFNYAWQGYGTPLRRGLETVGKYYEDQLGSSHPTPLLPLSYGGACQKNFAILFTDGYWNGNNPAAAIGDSDGDGINRTLADVANYYCSQDLNTTLPNSVVPDSFDTYTFQHMVTFTVAFGVQGNLVDTDSDGWPNPPLAGNGNWGDPTSCSDCPEKVDDLWHAAYNGRGTYVAAQTPAQVTSALKDALGNIQQRVSSASSVALNSGFISSSSLLFQARFKSGDWNGELLAYGIISDPTSPNFGQLDNGTTDATHPYGEKWDAARVLDDMITAGTPRTIYTFKPSTHSGVLFNWSNLDPSQTAALNLNPVTGVSDSLGEFRLDYLRGARSCEKGQTSCAHDFNGDGSVNGTTDAILRKRTTVLGDIIDSSPVLVGAPNFYYPDNWGTVGNGNTAAPENAYPYSAFKAAHAGRTPVVYAGANDGMLHGFEADTTSNGGKELLAYVPSAVYGDLNQLTNGNYSHRFYVDGSPTAVDAFFGSAWHTVLAGGLNHGGQGIYALDVTDPSTFGTTSPVMWEFNDTDDCESYNGTTCRTGSQYHNYDLGYTYAQPAIVRMHNGKWAAVFGNGYNNTEADGHASSTGHAVLYIVFLDGPGSDGVWNLGTDYVKIDTGAGSGSTPNGLATAAPVDVDGDGIVDYIYAGDLQGNMWRFDVTNSNTSQWDNAGSLKLLFSAGSTKPITSRPEVGRSPDGQNLMVYFGTGKYLGSNDVSNTDVQTFYAIIDDGTTGTVSASDLQQQTILYSGTQAPGGTGDTLRVTSSNALSKTQKGWYMNLPAGERVVSDPLLRAGRIIFTTTIPNSDACSYGGTGWLMELDARDGSRLNYSPFDLNNDRQFTVDDWVQVNFDVNNDGTVDANDKLPASGKQSQGGLISRPGVMMGSGGGGGGDEEFKYNTDSKGGIQVTGENPGPTGTGRQSWRQIR